MVQSVFNNAIRRKIHALKGLVVLLLLLFQQAVHGQYCLINDTVARGLVERCLDDIYNFNFENGKLRADSFRCRHPDYPAGPFLQALVLYWEHLPLTPAKIQSESFVALMQTCMDMAAERLERDEMEVEGVFFDLVGQGMLMMYYADNGMAGKVIPYLAPSYRSLKKGFELQEVFGEFLFTTGLYNYYIEAYPEKYTAYKPLALLFPHGDKKMGIQYLEQVAAGGLYLRNEARVFLNHLYLSYENNPEQSLGYIRHLSNEYPDNYFYRIRLMLNLVALGKNGECATEMNVLRRNYSKNKFVVMALQIFDGYIYENVFSDNEGARKKYLEGIKTGKEIGAWVNTYLALAYAGLSRIYQKDGDSALAREYEKLARSHTKYEFIFEME